MPLHRLSALDSPQSITKTIFRRAEHPLSSSFWTPPIVSSFTNKPNHKQEDSFSSPSSSASYLFIFCLISILESSLQLVLHLIESEAKPPKSSAFLKKSFFPVIKFLQSISVAINLSQWLPVFTIILSPVFTASAILPPFHLQLCFIWSSVSHLVLISWSWIGSDVTSGLP